MKMRTYNASPEYLEDLCDQMLEWVKDPNALTIPQFLQKKGIGYPFFKYFVYASDKVCNTYEIMKSILCNRWLHMAMTKDELPPHRAKVLMRYLRLYDSHALDMEQMAKEQLEDARVASEMKYTLEKYDRKELSEPYKSIYNDNVNKRRD